jgi:carboxyl-terminal processing protease
MLCQTLREYDGLTAIVTEQFYDRSFRGIDWPARVAFYRKQVSCGDADVALAAQINTLLSDLHASHTGLYTKSDLDYWALQSIFSTKIDTFPIASSGIWPKRIGQAQYAAYVLEDSPAARAGVLPGDLLVSVDGGPFDPLKFSARGESSLVVSSDGHTQRTVQVRAVFESTQSAFLRASIASAREIQVGGKRVGYFHLWAGTHERFLELRIATCAEHATRRNGDVRRHTDAFDRRNAFRHERGRCNV